jgi:hypothetical protein
MSGARLVWLVSGRFDLAFFFAPAILALLLVPLGPYLAPAGETPTAAWVVAVLLVDVGHVWSTLYRTYLDRRELARRPWLYALTPALGYAVGLAIALFGEGAFWTALAYLAAFHFVRQQYGFMALAARQEPPRGRLDRALDAAAIYAATLYPLLWWHAHLPRRFDWFLPGDFAHLPLSAATVDSLLVPQALLLGAFLLRQSARARATGCWPAAKVLVVVTTALTWGIGIIATDSDWAFTVTNVLAHGVPYYALVWRYGRRSAEAYPARGLLAWIFGGRRWAAFVALAVVLAYLEELGWDRLFWHERPALFPGPALDPGAAAPFLLPLLALPQVVHYVLDGFIWRAGRSDDPRLAALLQPAAGAPFEAPRA